MHPFPAAAASKGLIHKVLSRSHPLPFDAKIIRSASLDLGFGLECDRQSCPSGKFVKARRTIDEEVGTVYHRSDDFPVDLHFCRHCLSAQGTKYSRLTQEVHSRQPRVPLL